MRRDVFNLNLISAFESSATGNHTFLFDCGCEVDCKDIPTLDGWVVFHHPPKEDLTLPLCPLWQCNHEFDNDEDNMTHYGFCTPLNIVDR